MIWQEVLTRDPPLELAAVVDESVLRRRVGGRVDMDNQLQYLKRHAAEQRWLTIRFALENWARTARLCVIMLVMSVPVDTLAWLIRRR
jgi:hypothetical protein